MKFELTIDEVAAIIHALEGEELRMMFFTPEYNANERQQRARQNNTQALAGMRAQLKLHNMSSALRAGN